MPYLFATEDLDYSDYASGRVIYNLPGLPAFPVRLASEIFLRALERLHPSGRLTLYDPTCGGAYSLAALGLLHGPSIGAILASDTDDRAVELARRNLSLLSPQGLDRREQELRAMLESYGKESHVEALKSLQVLRQRASAAATAAASDADESATAPPIRTRVFKGNALDAVQVKKELRGETIRLVFSDIPYGQLSGWQVPDGLDPSRSPLWHLLAALLPVLSPGSLVAIAADKSQKIAHESYRRVERFQVGKRQVSFLEAVL